MPGLNSVVILGVWGVGAAALACYLLVSMRGPDQSLFLPGQTTAGHYQIELQCSACHFDDGGVDQDSCLRCHQEELEHIGDSHPIAKFAKATKAIMLQPIDGAMNAAKVKTGYCVTCHVEHTPQATNAMGLTQPGDYCQACHDDIQENRATHEGLAFTTCLNAGCHNFHDNSALFERYLVDRRDEPIHLADQTRVLRDYGERLRARAVGAGTPVVALTRAQADAPSGVEVSDAELHDWETTAHALAGVNCMGCHSAAGDSASAERWVEKPTFASCQACHEQETHGFLGSRHGMRLNAGMSAMTPGQARLPMKAAAASTEMDCASCHGSHTFDTQHAAFAACVTCHDDTHTNSYKQSPHFQLWQEELSGVGEPGSGVSCATCHLPRVVEGTGSDRHVEVKHNQNDFLRPNEKMIRSVCASCHGLAFTLDALADRPLIDRNFDGLPAGPHADRSSYDMIRQKLDRLRKEGRLEE